jgi:DinB family protein
MPITPDTKDWTWVLERRCPECGFESAAVTNNGVGQLILENSRRWQEILGRPTDLAARPSDDRWSALEYACHVRDVFRLYEARLRLMLGEDDPMFPNWDQDVTAIDDRYSEQDPRRVAVELAAAARQLAASFDGVSGDQWQRTGTRSDGARFTVDSFARYMIHDPVHHVHDVVAGFAALDAES